jgi:hypothetical protein
MREYIVRKAKSLEFGFCQKCGSRLEVRILREGSFDKDTGAPKYIATIACPHVDVYEGPVLIGKITWGEGWSRHRGHTINRVFITVPPSKKPLPRIEAEKQILQIYDKFAETEDKPEFIEALAILRVRVQEEQRGECIYCGGIFEKGSSYVGIIDEETHSYRQAHPDCINLYVSLNFIKQHLPEIYAGVDGEHEAKDTILSARDWVNIFCDAHRVPAKNFEKLVTEMKTTLKSLSK